MDSGCVLLDRDSKLAQIERLVANPILHGSESLCHLLRYLARQSVDHPGTPLKEYQIATELLGRPADFDPRLDSSVRVQTGRLRSKLAEYYGGPGAEDTIVVELPKGCYSLAFRPHDCEPKAVAQTAEQAPDPLVRQILLGRWWFLLVAAASGGLIVHALTPPRAGAAAEQLPAALRTFWRGFLDAPEPPLVVYSNAAFVGRPETGMRYFDGREPGAPIMDHYTGVGEVMAIHALDRVFLRFDRSIRLKRGRLLTWDDAKTSQLIFVGSTAENLSLRELPGTREFRFSVRDSGPRKGDLAIANLHPRPGEQPYYFASPGLPVVEDYAVVGLVPGLSPEKRILILAGTTTFGTQAAVEFVAEPGSAENLLAKLGQPRGEVPAFEALVRVKISGGVPVHSELVALRR